MPKIGKFSLDRTLLDHNIWLDEKFTRGQAWVDLIGLANWENSYIRVRGKRIEIPRGSLGWSNEKLYKRWGWSKGKFTRFIKELQNDKMITLKTVPHFFIIISIQNYNNRQTFSNQIDPQIGLQIGLQTDPIKETNKKLIKKDKGKTSKNSRLPCTEKELYEIARKYKVGVEDVVSKHEDVLNYFANHKTNHISVYLTLENWLRRDIKKGEIQSTYPLIDDTIKIDKIDVNAIKQNPHLLRQSSIIPKYYKYFCYHIGIVPPEDL